jgi:hypothetical protein
MKRRGVANAFDVEQDVMAAVVIDQVVEDLPEIDVGGAPQRDDAGKADAVAGGPVENGRADGARLRNQRQIADVRVHAGKSGIQAKVRTNDPQAVRAEQADSVAAGDLHHLAFERSPRVPCLGKAGRDDDGVLDAAAAALLDDSRHRLRSGDDDRELDTGADLFDGPVRRHALDRVVLRVDRIQTTFVARIEDVLEEHVADRVRSVGGADYRDRFRFKQRSEVVMFLALGTFTSCL